MLTEFEIIKYAICFATPETGCPEKCILMKFCELQADRYSDQVKKRWFKSSLLRKEMEKQP